MPAGSGASRLITTLMSSKAASTVKNQPKIVAGILAWAAAMPIKPVRCRNKYIPIAPISKAKTTKVIIIIMVKISLFFVSNKKHYQGKP